MDAVLAVLVGVGLAASCGFRVFVPFLVTSAAALGGYLDLAQSFDWLGTWTAFSAFAVATLVEILAYYVPWLDNLLDALTSPLAVIAGMVLFAASVTGIDPFLKWTLAVIAGGGSAALVQGGTVLTRVASTATTGGLANFVVATVESLAGVFFSLISIVLPLVAVILIVVAIGGMFYIGRQVLRQLVTSRAMPGDAKRYE
jgi:hypothetical protein